MALADLLRYLTADKRGMVPGRLERAKRDEG